MAQKSKERKVISQIKESSDIKEAPIVIEVHILNSEIEMEVLASHSFNDVIDSLKDQFTILKKTSEDQIYVQSFHDSRKNDGLFVVLKTTKMADVVDEFGNKFKI